MDVARPRELPAPSRLLAREVLIHGPISRADLAARMGMSLASLTRLSKPLIDSGLLVETEGTEPAFGRPIRPLDVRPDARTFLGVKLSGESASAVLTDLRAEVLDEGEAALPDHRPEAVVEEVARLTERMRLPSTVAAGISVGGSVGAKGEVRRAPFLSWRDVPFGRLAERRLDLPVHVENDLVALTAAEQWFGEGRGKSDFALLTIGAGVGYGLVQGDRVISRADTGLGLAGHFPLREDGPTCGEGHVGCASAVLTIDGVERQVADELGRAVPYEDALDLAAAGEPGVRRVVDRVAAELGTLVAAVANLAMVNDVILTGEGIRLAQVARRALDEGLSAHRDPEATPVRIILQPTGFAYWARGAAAVAIQRVVLGED